MKIERYQPGRRQPSLMLITCGCLGFGGIGIAIVAGLAMLIFPLLPGMVLSNFGLEEIGDTSDILNQAVPTIPALMDAQTVGSVTLSTGSYSQTFEGGGTGVSIIIGDTEDTMQLQMQVTFTEDGLLQQCRDLTAICTTSGENGIRNASFDLRPGGMVINGEFELQSGIWQNAGLVVQVDGDNRLDIVGVQIGGSVFAPRSTELSNIVNQAETQANLFVEQMSARAGINSFDLGAIVIDDNTMTLIMR